MDILGLMILVIVLFAALGIVTLAFIKYWLDIKRLAPEAKVFMKARKKKLAVLEISDTAGRTAFTIGAKRKKSDVHFQGSEYGIQIDPKLQGNAPENRTIDGVPIHHFSTQYPFSMSDKNARALERIVEHARDNFPELDFLMDSDILILANTPRDNLDHDINNYIMEFEPEVERDVLSMQFGLNKDDGSALSLNYGLIEELNKNGLDVGYKPLFDSTKIITDNEIQKELVEYLNAQFNDLNLEKTVFSVPDYVVFNWSGVMELNRDSPRVLAFLRREANVLENDDFKLQVDGKNGINLVDESDNIVIASLTLDKRRRRVTLSVNGKQKKIYKYKQGTGDVYDDTATDENIILQITNKSDVIASFERDENNICSLSLPALSINPDIEFGVISDAGVVGIPDAVFNPSTNDNEYTLTTESNEKYTLINEKEMWNVYKEQKETVKLTKDDVIEQISQLQEEIQTVPIKQGFFSYAYAFNNSPMGMLAQDMQQLTLLIQRLMREEMKGEWEKYVPLAFGVLIIVVAIIAIVTTLGGGGGA